MQPEAPFLLGTLERIRSLVQQQHAAMLNSTAATCSSPINMIVVYEFALIPAVLMIIVGCFSEKRSDRLLHLCHGRPGVTWPMNILEDRTVRFSYAMAFGIAAQMCNDLLFGDSDLYTLHITESPPQNLKFLHVVYRFCEVCLYCAVMYPILLTITKRNQLFFVMGSLYTWLLTAVTVVRLATTQCTAAAVETRATFVLKYTPSLICMLCLCCTFPYSLYQLCRSSSAAVDITAQEKVYQFDYVRELLRPRAEQPQAQVLSLGNRLRTAVRQLRYQRTSGFRYSGRIICTHIAVGIVIYMVIYNALLRFFYWRSIVEVVLDRLEAAGGEGGSISQQVPSYRVLVSVFSVCVVISACLTLLLNLINSLFSVVGYRASMLQIYKGDYTWFPTRRETTTRPVFLILSNLSYGGFQIAFTGIAIVLQLLMFQALLTFITMGLFDPLEMKLRQWFVETLEFSWPLLSISATVLLGQVLLSRVAFSSPHASLGKLAINNRHVFFNWNYFMFYFNVFWGIVTSVVHIVLSMVLAVCFLSRLDWCFFPKRFEFLDEGYFSYVGLLYIENAHTNPVLRTFLSLLADSRQGRFLSISRSHFTLRQLSDLPRLSVDVAASAAAAAAGTIEDAVARSRRVRTRWQLAVTLSNNPGLQQQRCHNIRSFKAAQMRKRFSTEPLGC